MFFFSQKKRKKALLRNGSNLKAIWEEYYSEKFFTNTVKDRDYQKTYFVHHVKEIMERYGLNSMHELIFLLHRHNGKVIKTCEFCNHVVTSVKTRTGYRLNFDDCGCKGICILCKKTYHHANDDGVCYNCRPYDHEEPAFDPDNMDQVYWRFFDYINHGSYQNIESMEEAQAMMKLASHFYYKFEEIRDQFIESDSKEKH